MNIDESAILVIWIYLNIVIKACVSGTILSVLDSEPIKLNVFDPIDYENVEHTNLENVNNKLTETGSSSAEDVLTNFNSEWTVVRNFITKSDFNTPTATNIYKLFQEPQDNSHNIERFDDSSEDTKSYSVELNSSQKLSLYDVICGFFAQEESKEIVPSVNGVPGSKFLVLNGSVTSVLNSTTVTNTTIEDQNTSEVQINTIEDSLSESAEFESERKLDVVSEQEIEFTTNTVFNGKVLGLVNDDMDISVDRKSLQDTKDILFQWLGGPNVDLSHEEDISKHEDEGFGRNVQETGDWLSDYEQDVLQKMFELEWILEESLDRVEKFEFSCVEDELWDKLYFSGRIRFKECEYTWDCETDFEEQSRWRRYITRAPEFCRKGTRLVRRTCRKIYG